jgi:hypothetical protein
MHMTTLVTEKTIEPKEATRFAEGHHVSMESVRHQLVTYGNEIEEYLKRVDANVEGYKFSVEKRGEGIEVEVEFKALIHPKVKGEIPK